MKNVSDRITTLVLYICDEFRLVVQSLFLRTLPISLHAARRQMLWFEIFMYGIKYCEEKIEIVRPTRRITYAQQLNYVLHHSASLSPWTDKGVNVCRVLNNLRDRRKYRRQCTKISGRDVDCGMCSRGNANFIFKHPQRPKAGLVNIYPPVACRRHKLSRETKESEEVAEVADRRLEMQTSLDVDWWVRVNLID